MSEEKQSATKPRKRRRWLRRVVKWLLVLLLLLLVFHRPIVHHGGRSLAVWIAQREGITLDLRIGGNLWSGIELRDVCATGGPGAPLERLSLDRAAVEYSLPKLVRGDLSGLRAVEIGTLDAVITPQPPRPRAEPEKPRKPLAQQLHEFLEKPLPAPRVSIGRVDVRVRAADGEMTVRGLSLRDGVLAWEAVEVPGVPRFEAVNAMLALREDRLELTGMKLWPELELASLALTRGGGVSLKAAVAGGLCDFSMKPDGLENVVRGSAQLDGIAVEKLAARFGAVPAGTLTMKSLSADFSLTPEDVMSAQADAKLLVEATAPKPGPGARLDGEIKIARGVVEVRSLSLVAAGLEISADGRLDIGRLHRRSAKLPEDGRFAFRVEAPDLALAGREFDLPLAGRLNGGGTLAVSDGAAALDATLDASGIRIRDVEMADAKISATFSKDLSEEQPLAGAKGEVTLVSGAIKTGAVVLDRVSLAAKLDGLLATLTELRIVSRSNNVNAKGGVKLDAHGALAAAPEVQFQVDAPVLEEFGVRVNGASLRGALKGEGSLTAQNPENPGDLRALRGSVKLAGGALALGTAEIGELDAVLEIQNGVARVSRIAASVTGGNTLQIEGAGALTAPHAYDGMLKLDFPNLAALQSVFDVLGLKQRIGGALKLDWKGGGDIASHSGEAVFGAEKVLVDTLTIGSARIVTGYTPERVDVSQLDVAADKLRAVGKLTWAAGHLDVSAIEVTLDGQRVLAGSLSAPLDPLAKPPLPVGGRISADLTAEKLDLSKLFAALGRKAPVTGVVTVDIKGAGTLAKPGVDVHMVGAGLRPVPPDGGAPLAMGATDFEIRASLANDQLRVNGTIRQPELKPVAITASLPLPVQPLLDAGAIDFYRTPLSASVEMPVSELNFITRLSPAITALDGSAAVLMRASGTLAEPRFNGAVAIKVGTLRMANPSVPPVSGFNGRIVFADDTVTFERFEGEAGGGRFSLGGRINVAKPAEPEFDLAFRMKEMLLMRDDAILVRADSDVTLRGPLNSAAAAGTVFITQSRFAKDVEILPLSLPGRPKPAPRSVSQPAEISFPDPPLRDWKFDIAIKTRPDDPFRVRGNLARGEVALDLRLGGTGLEPWMTGAVSIENFRATLPVSTLNTRRGLVIFSREQPFVPRLDIEAESVIRRYTVIARVSGDATKPRLDLESEPPLAHGEILSLMTTGSLTGEIGANNTAMATRAAILVVKGWYKKLFKRDFPADSDDGGSGFMDRFEVELGNMDQRTGRQEVTAQFRVTDDLFFLGDLEMGGGFTGRVKYLIRFK